MVAKKEFGKARHISIDVPNYQVIKVMQSLNSLGCVKTHFSWGYYYYNITNEGIEFVRKYLGLPNEIVPRTILSQPLVTASSGQKSRTDGMPRIITRGPGAGGLLTPVNSLSDPGMERGSRLIGPRRGRQGMDRYQMGRSEFEREGEGDRAANWRSEYVRNSAHSLCSG